MSLLEKIEHKERAQAYDEYKPTLADLNRYFEDQHYVGDEETRLSLPIAIIIRKPCGVVSGAGTGKTLLTDIALELFVPSSLYTMEAGSEKSQLAKKEQINNAQILYLSEIQKAGKSDVVVELLKNLGEGKDYKYSRTKQGMPNETEEIVIDSGKALVYTKAIENAYDTDDELNRRFTRFTTDMSEKQNKNVVKSKAHRRVNPFRAHILEEKEVNALKYHMQSLLEENANNYVFVNPLADYLAEFIPTTFAVSRSFTDHYFDLMNGVAYFNKHERIIKEIEHKKETKKVVFVAPEDCWQLLRIYQKQFMQEVLNIPPNGIYIFEVFNHAKEKGMQSKATGGFFTENQKSKVGLTKEQIFSLLKERGIVLKDNLIQKLLLDLMMSGYITEEEIQTNNKKIKEYCLTGDAVNFEQYIDWSKAIEACIETMKVEFPEYASEYQEMYCNVPVFTDPMGRENFTVSQKAPEITEAYDDRDTWLQDD